MTDKILEALEAALNHKSALWSYHVDRAITIRRAELERKVPDDLRDLASMVLDKLAMGVDLRESLREEITATLLAVRDDATAKERERCVDKLKALKADDPEPYGALEAMNVAFDEAIAAIHNGGSHDQA